MRLFVAGELPAAARAALAGWAADVPARLLDPEMLHVTVFFLGEADEGVARAGLEALSLRPIRVRTAGAAWFGAALVVRLVDVGGALARLHGQGFPGWTGEGRALRPHVTVARARRGERVALPAVPPPELDVDLEAVALWRSHPGSRYEVLTRRMLPARTG